MALVKCGECGKDISDKAIACPNCGAPVATGAPVRRAPVLVPPRRKTSKWAYVGLVLIVGIILFIYRAIMSDHAAPLSAGLAGALREPKKVVSDRFSLKEGQAKSFSFNLNTDARIEVRVDASPKNVDVMLMTAADLRQFNQAMGKLFGGKYTYRQALSRQATMKMDQSEVLPAGAWAVVVQRPQEALIFGHETTVGVDVTVY